MQNRMMAGAALIAALAAIITTAEAGEGVIEINQAQALEGGVTTGDAPGFPVTIDTPGSYALTGNLNVVTDVNAIEIKADDVTLDLRGFHVRGSGGGTDVDGIAFERSGAGFFPKDRVEVRNGNIENFSGYGVLLGDAGRVLNLRLVNNEVGAEVKQNSVMRGNTAIGNALGLLAGRFSRIVDNRIEESTGGINCGTGNPAFIDQCVIHDNIVTFVDRGLLTHGSVIKGNTISHAGAQCILGNNNLIIDNLIQNCGTGISDSLGTSGSNSMRGNVLRFNTTDLDHGDPVFFLGPNQCGNMTCQ